MSRQAVGRNQLKWILDLRNIQLLQQPKIRGESVVHDTLAAKDKHPKHSTADFDVGNINKLQHMLKGKGATHTSLA